MKDLKSYYLKTAVGNIPTAVPTVYKPNCYCKPHHIAPRALVVLVPKVL